MQVSQLSAAYNVRIHSQAVHRIGGRATLKSGLAFSPNYLQPVQSGYDYLWFLGADTSAKALKGNILTDITRNAGAYTGGRWSGGMFNGIFVATNGVDLPQSWVPATGNKMVNLVNWPSNDRAKVIKPYLNVLVAMGLTLGGNSKPYTLKWSHPADPGTLPTTWDSTDATKDVGQVDVAQTKDILVDGLPLGKAFIVYKQESTYIMTPYLTGAGGLSSAFRIDPLFNSSGILGQDCVVTLPKGIHCVATPDDIIIHQGAGEPLSILDKRNRSWYRKQLGVDSFNKSYMFINYAFKEVWICIATEGSAVPNLALIWNWVEDVWTFATLPDATYMAYGPQEGQTTGGTTWDELEGSWNEMVGPWDSFTDQRLETAVLMAQGSTLYRYDVAEVDGVGDSYVERLDWPFGAVTSQGNVVPVYDRVKHYAYMLPDIEAPAGTIFTVEVGGRDEISNKVPIVWTPPIPFEVGRDTKVPIWTRAKYLSWRLKTTSGAAWRCDRVGFDFDVLGEN